MSRIVVIEYVSLDGVVQAPGHVEEDRAGDFQHGGWTAPFMATHSRYLTALLASASGFLLGRLTYDIWASYWPTVGDDESEIARAEQHPEVRRLQNTRSADLARHDRHP